MSKKASILDWLLGIDLICFFSLAFFIPPFLISILLEGVIFRTAPQTFLQMIPNIVIAIVSAAYPAYKMIRSLFE